MVYQQLGWSSLQISRIGFGCMSLKGDNPENERIIQQAINLGINYFDTADLYEKGINEVLVGRTLKPKRKEVIIATKAGNQWRPDGSGWDWNPRPEYILECVEKSLKRLDTDYIDLYQLHGGTMDDPIDDLIETFEQLVQQGKIRYYGISSIRPNVIREWIKRSNIVSVMMQYSLLDRRPEESCLTLLHDSGVGVLSRGALAQGLLVDKPAREYQDYSEEQVARAAKQVASISKKERTPAQTAIQYVLHNKALTSAVVGIRTFPQLVEASGAASAPALSEDEYNSLASALPPNRYKDHR